MRSNIARTCGSASVPDAGCGVSVGSAIPGDYPARAGPTERLAYWRFERNETSWLTCLGEEGAKPTNEGMGAVGFSRVDAIAPGRRVEPMCVSGGPGPLLPL